MSENLKNTDNRVGEELLHNKLKERVGLSHNSASLKNSRSQPYSSGKILSHM